MFRKKNRSRSVLSNGERIGIFWLLGFMGVFILIKTEMGHPEAAPSTVPSARLEAIRCELVDLAYQDSLNRLPRIYPFNPNFLSAHKAYRLGMTAADHDKLMVFRRSDRWIRSGEEFQQVTGISDSLLVELAPYFKFPSFETNWSRGAKRVRLDKAHKRDVNTATAAQLQAVYGIGESFARRILEHREGHGPFAFDRDLYRVYGVRPQAIDSLLIYFEVKQAAEAPRMELDGATASDLATIPGVDFELARKIWSFVRLRDSLPKSEDLLKIEGMTLNKLRRIELYLKVEKR